MTKGQELRQRFDFNQEAKARGIPPDARPIIARGWLTFINHSPHLLRQPKHRRDCLVAYIQGWLNGSRDILIDQELARLDTQQN